MFIFKAHTHVPHYRGELYAYLSHIEIQWTVGLSESNSSYVNYKQVCVSHNGVMKSRGTHTPLRSTVVVRCQPVQFSLIRS